MPYPYPTGEYNFLNDKFSGFTQLHSSAKQLKYDIVDLLLTYGADVNIKEDGNTLAYNAAELNDVLLLDVINSYNADFELLNGDGEPALMVAIALGNEEAIQFIWSVAKIHTQTENHETVLHYAARHNNPVMALQGCDPRYKIPVNQQSTHELRTALHVAVQQSNVEIARVLLQHGAQDNLEDRYGRRARDYVGRDEAMEALLEEHHLLKNQATSTSGSQQAAPTNENQPQWKCQNQPESDDMQLDTTRVHQHKQDGMQSDPTRAPTSSTRATFIATKNRNTQHRRFKCAVGPEATRYRIGN